MTSDPQVPPEQPSTPAEAAPVPAPPAKSAVPFTRVAAAWWALAVGLLILIVLLVFIAQNTDSITIRFLAWQWSSPKGISFLMAAVGGALITVLAGTARMVQMRRAAKKNLKAHLGHAHEAN
ncbi:LapA family protein [Mycobacterium sp.]|uniref:LapA family protein n=1 Tax=Mycobacterium sp. TaxID=1785 RepID=UPI002C08E691|nr:lipopolysaccharide assembly protein LapA domain-containing protein [Mycobacterium sp.]HME47383.1 lipopolysaccharide assembly protein LapA domain-containing protein [Mycobacterium sp.]